MARGVGGLPSAEWAGERERILSYFDLNERMTAGPGPQLEDAGTSGMSGGEQAIMYLSTALGVFGSSAIGNALKGEPPQWDFSWGWIAAALFISLVLMPGMAGALKLPRTSPIIFRIGFFVQQGVFWQTLVQALEKSAGSGP